MVEKLSVRPCEVKDMGTIVDYFLSSDADYLKGMGVDRTRLPSKSEWLKMLNSDFLLPIEKKMFYYVVWLLNGEEIGHSNINKIIYGQEAYMHLHLWHGNTRQKGWGLCCLQMTLPYYFEIFQLKTLYCEPMASNPSPNRTLKKLGFEFIKSYETIPGWINLHQTVNRWSLARENLKTPGTF